MFLQVLLKERKKKPKRLDVGYGRKKSGMTLRFFSQAIGKMERWKACRGDVTVEEGSGKGKGGDQKFGFEHIRFKHPGGDVK